MLQVISSNLCSLSISHATLFHNGKNNKHIKFGNNLFTVYKMHYYFWEIMSSYVAYIYYLLVFPSVDFKLTQQ